AFSTMIVIQYADTSTAYGLLIVHFGDPTRLFSISTELSRRFYLVCLYQLPSNYSLCIGYSSVRAFYPVAGLDSIVVLCIITETVAACLFVGYSFLPDTTLNQLLTPGNFGADIGLTMMIAAACADIIIAASMVYLLRKTMVEGMTQ
ncbi:hypothetical protein MPER_05798, partial [Moniliophthora perniciosa FA553]